MVPGGQGIPTPYWLEQKDRLVGWRISLVARGHTILTIHAPW